MARPEPPATLYRDWLTRYQHIKRLGDVECEGLLDGEVIVQEKLDGANLTVARCAETGETIVCSRNQTVDDFNGARDYIQNHEGIQALLRDDDTRWWVLRGEWLIRHSIAYPADVQRKFYVFDVETFDTEHRYHHPGFWLPAMKEFDILTVPEIGRYTNPTAAELAKVATGDSILAPGTAREGAVVKRYGFVNRFGRTTWGKLVCADFKAKNRAVFGATRNDTWDDRFAALATPEYTLKTIHTIEDQVGRKLVISDMPRVLETVWHDLVTEEMYNFSKRHKSAVVDFGKAKRATSTAAREVALSYFNGTL